MAKNNYLKFDIAVRDYYGSTNTAIAFGRLLYWARKQPRGFYKFKQPCKKHPLYKKGDSWGEELGMSRKVLDPIMDRLVNRHLTKREYVRASDKFNGKMFASYTNHKTNQTYYFMDGEAVEEFLSSLAPEKIETPSLPSPVTSDAPEGVDNFSQEAENIPSFPCSDVPGGPHFARARQQPNTNTQTTTSLPGDVPGKVMDMTEEQEKLSSKKMVELWNSHTQDKVIWYPSTAGRLYKVLSDFFGGCIEAFKKYCAAIGNTPFLMGKASNSKFKAWFYWAIKPEVIKSIFQGAYGVENILSKIGNVSESDKLQYEINTIGYEILNTETKIKYSKQEIVDAQEKMIIEHRQALSQDVKDEIMKNAQEEINQKYPLDGYSEKNREILSNVQYHAALVNYSRAELKLCNPEDIVVPPELLAKKKALEDKRAAMYKRLEQVMKENLKAQNTIETLVEMAA